MKTVLIAALLSLSLVAAPVVLRSLVFGSGAMGAPNVQPGDSDTLLANDDGDPDFGADRALDRMFIHSGEFDVQSDRT